MSAPSRASSETVAGRLEAVRARIRAAAEAAGRDPRTVRLVAVSKTFPAGSVLEAASAGQVVFGESRIQEARRKIPEVNAAWADRGAAPAGADSPAPARRLEWRLIGHLQRNKVRQALDHFDAVDSVDSLRLLEALDAAATGRVSPLPVLLQFNCSGEGTKMGFAPGDLEEVAARVPGYRSILVTGLMTIGYHGDDPAEARPGFRLLRELRERLEERWHRPLPDLSMGMSGDLEVAVEEGATLVRVGTAIFGERPAPAP